MASKPTKAQAIIATYGRRNSVNSQLPKEGSRNGQNRDSLHQTIRRHGIWRADGRCWFGVRPAITMPPAFVVRLNRIHSLPMRGRLMVNWSDTSGRSQTVRFPRSSVNLFFTASFKARAWALASWRRSRPDIGECRCMPGPSKIRRAFPCVTATASRRGPCQRCS